MISLEELLARIKYRAVEKIVYTRNESAFTIRLEELPPIMPNAIRSDNTMNTEHQKQSPFLKSSQYTGMYDITYFVLLSLPENNYSLSVNHISRLKC
jgi:hypothetical protein